MKCTYEWHSLSASDYAKKHGGGFPRSCPQCHSIGEPSNIERIDPSLNANRDLYREAWTKWGSTLQLVMVMEECAELSKVCSKLIRTCPPDSFLESKIAEEIADVEIMLDQLKTIFVLPSTVETFKIKKLARLRDLVYGGNGDLKQ